MSPSFFNPEEAVTVLDYVREITSMKENRVSETSNKTSDATPCFQVLAKEIGVITPYRRQVQKIRKKLMEHNFRWVLLLRSSTTYKHSWLHQCIINN